MTLRISEGAGCRCARSGLHNHLPRPSSHDLSSNSEQTESVQRAMATDQLQQKSGKTEHGQASVPDAELLFHPHSISWG